MLVVLYHASAHVRDSGVDQGAFFALSEAVGFAGVDVFFVISGFIMAYTTREDAGLTDGWSFLRRRLARIYSGYWPFFLLALFLFAWISPSHLKEANLVRSAILWPANDLLIGVSWTLIFEMYFYLLYTVLITFSSRRRSVLLVATLVFVGVWSLYSQFIRHAYDPGRLELISLAEYYMLSPYLAEFLAGALLAGWLGRHRGVSGWAWLAAGCALFLLAGWLNNSVFGGKIEQGYFVFYRVLAFGVPSLLILMGLERLEQAGQSAPVRFSIMAGGASYAVYLSHTLLLQASQYLGLNAWAGQLGTTTVRWVFGVYAVLILGYSVVHARLLERPLHRYFRRLLSVSSAIPKNS